MVHHLQVIFHATRLSQGIVYQIMPLCLEYQETACRSAKVLQVPLLYINDIITEGIALGNHWFSIKIRQIIDDAYEKFLLTLEKHK